MKNADGTDSDKTLVVIGVRGAGYEQEWISNLTLGLKGEAKGFSSAAKQVFAELKKCLKMKDIDGSSENTIFWVAGYSRAGATSNLTGKRIVDAYDTKGERTFAYTFEAPQGGSNEGVTNGGADTNANYRCIHNVINDVDIVPKVGPSKMGFFRYGVDHYVPGSAASSTLTEASTTYYSPDSPIEKSYKTWHDNNVDRPGAGSYDVQKNKMLTQLRTISGYNIIFSDYYHPATMKFLANKVWGNLGTQLIEESSTKVPGSDAGTFGTNFLNDLMAKEFRYKTNRTKDMGVNSDKFYRYNYSAMARGDMTFEEAVGKAAGVVFSLTTAQMEGLSSIGATIQDRIDATDFYLKFLRGSRKASNVADEIWNALTKETSEGRAMGYTYLQDYLTKEQLNTLKSAFPALCDVLLKYLKDDYSATGCDMIGTFGYNAMRILSAHYPEVSIAWVRSYDNYYDNETATYSVADSAKITSKGSWRVKAKSNTITYGYPFVELYVAGEPGQDSDEDRGASLFFWFNDETKLHPYCGPIDVSLYLQPEQPATIHAFSIHDGIMTTVQDIPITREKRYQLSYPVYDEAGSYTKTTVDTELGKTHTIEAPQEIEGKVFKAWKVKYSYRDPFTGEMEYTTFHTSSGSERLQQTLFTYLPGFSLTDREFSFEVNALGNYEIEAVYTEPEVIRSVTLTLGFVESNKALPKTTMNGADLDTEWQGGSGEYTVVTHTFIGLSRDKKSPAPG